MWIFILITICFIAFLFFYYKFRKIPKLGNMTLITGGIKTGKSTLSVYLAIRKYKRNHLIWKIKKTFCKIFNKKIPEEPLFYSNIPLKIPYVDISNNLLMRKKRFNYKSIAYICEASLIADSQLIKNQDINENLLLFNKLFAHETRGGSIFYDTQSIADCHYSIKRALSSYIDIHHTFKWIPFILLMWTKERTYSEDNSIVNTVDKDPEEELKLIIVPKNVWKKFDCYCYSSFTDELPIENEKKIAISLKVDELVSFREFKNENIRRKTNDKI